MIENDLSESPIQAINIFIKWLLWAGVLLPSKRGKNGATTLVITTFSLMAYITMGIFATLRLNDTRFNSALMLNVVLFIVILGVAVLYCCTDCCNAECCYVKCCYGECRGAVKTEANYKKDIQVIVVFLFSLSWQKKVFRNIMEASKWDLSIITISNSNQGILKGEVSLYHWPPFLLVWISLFCI